jgi:hypothetical protein
VTVGVGVIVGVSVMVGVRVAVPVAELVGVIVRVALGDEDGVDVGEADGVLVWVGVSLGVAVGTAAARPQPPWQLSLLSKTVTGQAAAMQYSAHDTGVVTSTQNPALHGPPLQAQHMAAARVASPAPTRMTTAQHVRARSHTIRTAGTCRDVIMSTSPP